MDRLNEADDTSMAAGSVKDYTDTDTTKDSSNKDIKKRKDKKKQLEQDDKERDVKDLESDIEQSNTAGDEAVESESVSETEGEVAKALAEQQAAKGFGVFLSELSTQTLVLGSLGILGAATFFRNKDVVVVG